MRFEFWERRLSAVVELYQREPFEWARADCVLFAADCVWALTQKDPAAAYRGRYHDEAGARAIVTEAGGLWALAETGAKQAGIAFERIAPGFAQRGDPCLFTHEGAPTLGVVLGERLAAKAPAGLAYLPFTAAEIVWAIR